MPARWVISPVVTTISGPFKYRTPLVGQLDDVGSPNPDEPSGFNRVVFVAAINSGNTGTPRDDDCLCLIAAVNMASVDATGSVLNLFIDETSPTLAGAVEYIATQTPGTLNWTPGKLNSVKTRAGNAGVATSEWTEDTTLLEMANDSAQVWMPGFDFSRAVTSRVGA